MADLGLPCNDIQRRFIESNARFKIFRAARRVGKSYIGAWDVIPDVLTPNTRGWIVGPTYDLAEKEFRYIIDFLLKMNKKFKLPKPTIRDNAKSGELYIKTPWGSEVHGKSSDKAISLLGEENDWIILSEASQHKYDIWKRFLRPTLSSRLGRAIFPTTPDINGAWLYELELDIEEGRMDWVDDGQQSEDSCKLRELYSVPWETIHCAAWETQHLDKAEIEDAKKELSEDDFQEQYGGEWRFYAGRVFKPFSRAIHVIEPFPVPKGWRIRTGIDYGVRDATVVEWSAESTDGDFYFIDEYYNTSGDVATETHIEAVKAMERKYSPPIVRVADHHALGRQLCLDWSRKGLANVDANVDRKTRRDRFMSYLEPRDNRRPYHIREAGMQSGKYPKLFIFKRCQNLIRELLLLKWKDSTMKEGNYGDTIGDDHAVDAAEYQLWYGTKGIGRRSFRREARLPSFRLTGY